MQQVVGAAGYLMMANSLARALFNLRSDDVGRPFQNLEISYRPLELHSKIQQVYPGVSRSSRSGAQPPQQAVGDLGQRATGLPG